MSTPARVAPQEIEDFVRSRAGNANRSGREAFVKTEADLSLDKLIATYGVEAPLRGDLRMRACDFFYGGA